MKVPPDGFVRDAEIKHGRVAMTSAATLATLSQLGFDHPSRVLSECSLESQLLFFSVLGIVESATYLPRLDLGFTLKRGVEPGNVLGIETCDEVLVDVEDFMGRTCMISVAAFMILDGIDSLSASNLVY